MVSPDSHPYAGFLRDNRRELVILLVLGALAGTIIYFFSTSQSIEPETVEERGVLNLNEISVLDYQQENKRWKLHGKRAVVLEESRRMRIEEVRVWVYASSEKTETLQDNQTQPISAKEIPSPPVQKVDVYITAEQGLIEWRDNRVTLSGNVLLLRDDGTEIHTDSAIYDAKSETLNLPKTVRLFREGLTLLGNSLTYHVAKGKFILKQPLMLRHDRLR